MLPAIGRPWRSAIAMILLPFPRRVGPTVAPFFRQAEAGIDESFQKIEFAARPQIFGEGLQQLRQRAVALPLSKAAMAGLVGRLTVAQIVPRSSGAQNREYPIQHGSRIAPQATSIIRASPESEQRPECLPLRLDQVHALPLRQFAQLSSLEWLDCVYEITCSARSRPYLCRPRRIPLADRSQLLALTSRNEYYVAPTAR